MEIMHDINGGSGGDYGKLMEGLVEIMGHTDGGDCGSHWWWVWWRLWHIDRGSGGDYGTLIEGLVEIMADMMVGLVEIMAH